MGGPILTFEAHDGMSPSRLILVVEDDSLLRRITTEALRTRGYRTLEAANAAEALDHLGRAEIDLLLTDVHMPGEMDGLALAFAVCQRWPRIPVVLLSGHLDPATTRIPKGTAFLRKPCSLTSLIALLSQEVQARCHHGSGTLIGVVDFVRPHHAASIDGL